MDSAAIEMPRIRGGFAIAGEWVMWTCPVTRITKRARVDGAVSPISIAITHEDGTGQRAHPMTLTKLTVATA